RTASPGAHQYLAVEHRDGRGHALDRAYLRGQVLIAADLLPRIGLDADMAVHAQDARHQLGLKAAHDGCHDDERGNTERDADQGEDRDDGDEPLALARTQVAPGDHAFERSEHHPRPLPPRPLSRRSATGLLPAKARLARRWRAASTR